LSRVKLQEPRGVAAQDQVAILGRQLGELLDRADDVLHAHVGREVGPAHDAIGAH